MTIPLLFFCASCALNKNFYVGLDSKGTKPQSSTYCVFPGDTSNVDYLEFDEYAEALKTQLAKLGYVETCEDPELKIYLYYSVGEKILVGTNSSTTNSSTVVSNLKGGTNKTSSGRGSATTTVNPFMITTNANGSKTSNSKSNYSAKTYSYGGSSTYTTQEVGVPLYVTLEAVNVDSNKPVWNVSMEYLLSNSFQVSRIMPWLFVCARWFIGHRWSGIINVYTNKLKKESPDYPNYPFGGDDWSLQYHYFKGANWYIKSEPNFDK